MQAEQFTDPLAYHGEGPVWAESWGGLRWVDMLAGDVLLTDEAGATSRRHVGSVAAALRPRADGGAIIAVERGFCLEAPDGALTQLPEVWSDAGIRMNDGGCDPQGRFYCGTMAYDASPGAAKLYRIDPDLSVHTVLEGATISNGLEWSPDGSLAYYNDTDTHTISVFDHDPDTGLTGRRPFVVMSDEENPDGLTVDADGGIWVAMHGAGEVRRYTPNGALDEVITVDARQTTACTFGGAKLDRLFITTSRENLEPGDDPLAGALFVIDAGVVGMPARTFAG